MNIHHTQTYQVAISPDLDISAEEFARVWNADPTAHNLATAQFAEEKASKFMDPTMLAALLSVPAGVTTMEVYDLIKGIIERLRKDKSKAQPPHSSHKHLHIEQTRKPDGTEIIIVDYDEA